MEKTLAPRSKQPKSRAANSPKKGRGKTATKSIENRGKNSGGIANLRPFQKGVSGNPGGRPKESEDLKALARSYTVEAVERLAYWMRSENPKASVAAAGILLDRAHGKAPQALTDADGNNLGPIILYADDAG